MKHKIKFSLLVLAVLCISYGSASAVPVPIDLSTWSVIQYEFNVQPDANWSLSAGNTVATQSVNADASILLSDFNIAGQQIEGSWRVNTSGDDDFMGFVFGYQGRGQFYLFDWKQTDQTHLGFADAGMSVKLVNVPGNADPNGTDLWATAGTANVTLLMHNTIPYSDFTDYEFRLNFTPGLFEIEVKQGNTSLEEWLIADNSLVDGNFGFYNYSQGNVIYSGFTQDDEPPPIIPEPSTVLLLGSGLLGMIGFRKKFNI